MAKPSDEMFVTKPGVTAITDEMVIIGCRDWFEYARYASTNIPNKSTLFRRLRSSMKPHSDRCRCFCNCGTKGEMIKAVHGESGFLSESAAVFK